MEIKCGLCNKPKNGESWSEEHVTMGISGFNFTFCPNCETDKEACDKFISNHLYNWRKQCKEHWDKQRKYKECLNLLEAYFEDPEYVEQGHFNRACWALKQLAEELGFTLVERKSDNSIFPTDQHQPE